MVVLLLSFLSSYEILRIVPSPVRDIFWRFIPLPLSFPFFSGLPLGYGSYPEIILDGLHLLFFVVFISSRAWYTPPPSYPFFIFLEINFIGVLLGLYTSIHDRRMPINVDIRTHLIRNIPLILRISIICWAFYELFSKIVRIVIDDPFLEISHVYIYDDNSLFFLVPVFLYIIAVIITDINLEPKDHASAIFWIDYIIISTFSPTFQILRYFNSELQTVFLVISILAVYAVWAIMAYMVIKWRPRTERKIIAVSSLPLLVPLLLEPYYILIYIPPLLFLLLWKHLIHNNILQ